MNEDQRHVRNEVQNEKRKVTSSSWLFGIGVVGYLVIAYGLFVWLQGKALPAHAETVGVLIQATVAAAAIFGVSLALLQIARNSDDTFDKQRKLTERQFCLAQLQRHDDEVDFVEKHLQEALEPYTKIVNAVRYILVGIQAAPALSCDHMTPSDRLDQIDKAFGRIFAGGMQSPIVEAVLAWKSSWSAQLLLAEGGPEVIERKVCRRTDTLNWLCNQLMMVAMRYSETIDALKQPDISNEQRGMFFDLLYMKPHIALERFIQISAIDTSGRTAKFNLIELDKNLPNLDDVKRYIESLKTDLIRRPKDICNKYNPQESFYWYPTAASNSRCNTQAGVA